MKITLDLETNKITVPKNFFDYYEKQNQMIAKLDGEPIDPMEVVKRSFQIAMSNTASNIIARK